MLASFVNVTTSGLFACPLAPTVSAVVKVWEVPLVAVANDHVTPLGRRGNAAGLVVVSALVVYPVA